MAKKDIRFVNAWPSISLWHESEDGKLTQCLWGDMVVVLDPKAKDGLVKVYARRRKGRLPAKALMEERPLEVNFVDVGQGDGTFIVTPDNKNILVDAGAEDNMYRFLKWRFDFEDEGQAEPGDFEAAIITHPDKDHYFGFQQLFEDKRFRFKTVFHNGIVERKRKDKRPKFEVLGPFEEHDDQRYLTDVVFDRAALKKLLNQKGVIGGNHYPAMLLTALHGGRVDDIRMLAAGEEAFPTRKVFGKSLSMKAFAPVPEKIGGRWLLRSFGRYPGKTKSGDVGKTKNGHSVVTVLQYGQVRILLGGDLNVPAECYLMQYYRERGEEDVFRADVAKACHHGSADFSTEFLQLVNPLATVICSGDDENYCHPRPDSLGTVGKFSRGNRSLILSTELARSAPERIKHPQQIRQKILDQATKMVNVYRTAKDKPKEELEKKFQVAQERLKKTLKEKIQRSVEVYGMITLRTDGEKVLLAQRLEKTAKRQKDAAKPRKLSTKNPTNWHVDCLEPENGVLTFHSKPGKPEGRQYRCP